MRGRQCRCERMRNPFGDTPDLTGTVRRGGPVEWRDELAPFKGASSVARWSTREHSVKHYRRNNVYFVDIDAGGFLSFETGGHFVDGQVLGRGAGRI